MPLLGRVLPVWALSCVTLRVLCACRRSVWQAPNSRLTVTAPVTGWYWRDRLELPSGCGLLALSKSRSDLRSGVVRPRDGRTAIVRTAVATRVWQLCVAAGWGTWGLGMRAVAVGRQRLCKYCAVGSLEGYGEAL